eukprot:scaffold2097_cov403-Prasinococcus_capsulatus_cf.AAC.16
MGLCERFEIDIVQGGTEQARSPALVNYRKLLEVRRKQRQLDAEGCTANGATGPAQGASSGLAGSGKVSAGTAARTDVDDARASKLEARLVGLPGRSEEATRTPGKEKKQKAQKKVAGLEDGDDGFIDDGDVENGLAGDPFEDLPPPVTGGGAARMNDIIQKYSNIQQELARRVFKDDNSRETASDAATEDEVDGEYYEDETDDDGFLDDTELQDALEEPETKATLTGFFVNKGELEKSVKPRSAVRADTTPVRKRKTKSVLLGTKGKIAKKHGEPGAKRKPRGAGGVPTGTEKDSAKVQRDAKKLTKRSQQGGSAGTTMPDVTVSGADEARVRQAGAAVDPKSGGKSGSLPLQGTTKKKRVADPAKGSKALRKPKKPKTLESKLLPRAKPGAKAKLARSKDLEATPAARVSQQQGDDDTEDEGGDVEIKSKRKNVRTPSKQSDSSLPAPLTSPSKGGKYLDEPPMPPMETTYTELLNDMRKYSESLPELLDSDKPGEGRAKRSRTPMAPYMKKLLSFAIQKKAAGDDPCRIGEGLISSKRLKEVRDDACTIFVETKKTRDQALRKNLLESLQAIRGYLEFLAASAEDVSEDLRRAVKSRMEEIHRTMPDIVAKAEEPLDAAQVDVPFQWNEECEALFHKAYGLLATAEYSKARRHEQCTGEARKSRPVATSFFEKIVSFFPEGWMTVKSLRANVAKINRRAFLKATTTHEYSSKQGDRVNKRYIQKERGTRDARQQKGAKPGGKEVVRRPKKIVSAKLQTNSEAAASGSPENRLAKALVAPGSAVEPATDMVGHQDETSNTDSEMDDDTRHLSTTKATPAPVKTTTRIVPLETRPLPKLSLSKAGSNVSKTAHDVLTEIDNQNSTGQFDVIEQ